MSNEVQPNENLFYSDLKTRLQRDRREERLYIRLTKNEKERLRQFAGKVGMPMGEFVPNIGLAYTEQYKMMASIRYSFEPKMGYNRNNY